MQAPDPPPIALMGQVSYTFCRKVGKMTATRHPGEILLVDDDSLDATIVRRALRDLAVTNKLVHVTDGYEALAHLKGQDHETPCVILLDLNMPSMTGIEFLEIVKADEVLKEIPVVVVTTSDEQQDMTRSFELGAAAYVVKASNYAEFRQKIRTIERYLAPVQPPAQLEMAPS
jgi:CheY-like chemotaxis protein